MFNSMFNTETRTSQPTEFENTMINFPPSPASSASASSHSSVFSADGHSSQSSAPSSPKSEQLSWDTDSHPDDSRSAPSHEARSGTQLSGRSGNRTNSTKVVDAPIAPQLRMNPRRTRHLSSTVCGDQAPIAPHQPPSLVRQCERKDNFVESLVDTTTQMIEVIWPLSVVPCGRDAVLGGKNLIGLRTFIQEVLKRSKTSYSTLQVALYYLVLIKSCIPNVDFTKVQPEDTHASRAMQCGRRMFLAALILASKYLQDRNYSARAWSKISGLKIAEINSNEIAFVTAIDWKLHVTESRFQRWTDVVLKFSQSPLHFSPASCFGGAAPNWRTIIPHLTPELNDFGLGYLPSPLLSPECKEPPTTLAMSPPPRASCDQLELQPHDEQGQSGTSIKPQALEPILRTAREQFPFPPISPKITQLPTPQLTPGQSVLSTPAASCRRSSQISTAMSGAMKQIQTMSMLRCTVDPWPRSFMNEPGPSSSLNRRLCLSQRTPSMMSSPESMISDTSSISSRSSRSSSISSLSSASVGAPLQTARLAALATRRCTTLTRLNEEITYDMPGNSPLTRDWTAFEKFSGSAPESYVRGSNLYSKSPPTTSETSLGIARLPNSSLAGVTGGRKRERPRSDSESAVQDELRSLLAYRPTPSERSESHVVLSDQDEADSFLVHHDKRLHSICSPHSDINLYTCQQLRSRKRLCCNDGSHI